MELLTPSIVYRTPRSFVFLWWPWFIYHRNGKHTVCGENTLDNEITRRWFFIVETALLPRDTKYVYLDEVLE